MQRRDAQHKFCSTRGHIFWTISWRTFRIFFFFLLGAGKGGGVRGENGGGGYFHLAIERGGWVSEEGGGVVHTRAGRVSRGGGAKFFFGSEVAKKSVSARPGPIL